MPTGTDVGVMIIKLQMVVFYFSFMMRSKTALDL